MLCSGYRDTQQLRIRNESESVVRKALKIVPLLVPQSLPLSIDLQARDAFFAYYVLSTSNYWDFLKRYYHPTNSPDHLTLAIEAVSLAYLWHQVYSDAALANARKRYVAALSMTNEALKSSKEATKDITLLVVLLLDLFEKITMVEPQSKKSWICHVDGALTLVRLRGLEQFQDPSSLRILVRLSSNSIISCVASGSPVLVEFMAIRAFVGKRLDVQDPNWRLSGLMIQYANLRSSIRMGTLSKDQRVRVSTGLDAKLHMLDLNLPPSWQYSTTLLDQNSDRTLDYFVDFYPNRNVCQGRNGLRVIRILLNESLLEHYMTSTTGDKYKESLGVAHTNIETLAGEICASVPQYVDCDGLARKRLPTLEKSEFLDQAANHVPDRAPRGNNHSHTPSHQLDCYTLIIPLYVVGRSKASPDSRPWVIKQLHYIGSHFYIRAAEVVAQILERGTDVYPWEIYTMLGSYGFAA